MSEFDWSQAGINNHGELDNLWKDKHPQYLNEARHDVVKRHQLGKSVSHDSHGMLQNLNDDDHIQYLNTTRHNRERHPTSIVPEFTMVVTGGSSSEPVFTVDGDIIMTEVM